MGFKENSSEATSLNLTVEETDDIDWLIFKQQFAKNWARQLTVREAFLCKSAASEIC